MIFLQNQGFVRQPIPADGFCMVASWQCCLDIIGESYTTSSLMTKSIEHLISNKDFFAYSEPQIHQFKTKEDSASEIVDKLAYVLANITQTTCKILVVNQVGRVDSYIIEPTLDIISKHNITVAWFKHQLHYESVFTVEQSETYRKRHFTIVVDLSSDSDESSEKLPEAFSCSQSTNKDMGFAFGN